MARHSDRNKWDFATQVAPTVDVDQALLKNSIRLIIFRFENKRVNTTLRHQTANGVGYGLE